MVIKIRKVALIIFYDENKKILLQDRKRISRVGEEWGFFGGEIEENETPEQAIIRETKEELNFDLKEYKFIGEFKNKVNEGLIIDRFVFIAPLKDNLSKFEQLEGEKMQLFLLEEIEKLKMVLGDELVVQELKQIF